MLQLLRNEKNLRLWESKDALKKSLCFPPKALDVAGGKPGPIIHTHLDGLKEKTTFSPEKLGDAGPLVSGISSISPSKSALAKGYLLFIMPCHS